CFGRYRSRLGLQRAGGGRRRELCTACRQRESRHRRNEKSGMPHLRALVDSSCSTPSGKSDGEGFVPEQCAWRSSEGKQFVANGAAAKAMTARGPANRIQQPSGPAHRYV